MTNPFRRTRRRLISGVGLSVLLAGTVSACDPSKVPNQPDPCDPKLPTSRACATPAPTPTPTTSGLPKAMVSPYLKGTIATDLTIQDVDGKQHKLSEYKGKFIVLTVFAYWCPHCHVQLPRLENEVAAQLAGKNVVFIGVEGSGGTAGQVKEMAKIHNIKQPLYTGSQDDVQKAYLPYGFPTMYLISEDFKVHGFLAGEVDSTSLAAEVQSRLGVSPTKTQEWPQVGQ